MDDQGTDVYLTVRDAIYVPQCPVCLLSPQQVAQQTRHPEDGFNTEASSGILQIGGYRRTILCKRQSNLPILYTGSKLGDPSANMSLSTYTPNPSEPHYTVQQKKAFYFMCLLPIWERP